MEPLSFHSSSNKKGKEVESELEPGAISPRQEGGLIGTIWNLYRKRSDKRLLGNDSIKIKSNSA